MNEILKNLNYRPSEDAKKCGNCFSMIHRLEDKLPCCFHDLLTKIPVNTEYVCDAFKSNGEVNAELAGYSDLPPWKPPWSHSLIC